MSKDPAFLFYSQDFIVGVQAMNFEDRGKYITILALMHQQGRMDEETIRFLVGSVSDKLKSKFSVDESGHWFNKRLEDEMEKRAKFIDSRRENGKKGGRPEKPLAKPSAKPSAKPYAKPKQNLIEDENENENESKIEIVHPWKTDEFKQAWGLWKEYKRKEFSFKYKSEYSEQAALNKLNQLSGGVELNALKIISASMSNGWQGFFAINTGDKNTSETNEYKEDLLNRMRK